MFCLPISGDLPHIRLTFGIFHKDKLGHQEQVGLWLSVCCRAMRDLWLWA